MIQTTIPQVVNYRSNIGLARSIAKKREPGSTKMEVSWSSEETHAKQLKIQTNPVNDHSEEIFPSKERKWNDISASQYFKRNTFEVEVSKLVMRLVRRYDQNERETDGSKTATTVSENWRTQILRL